MNKQLKKDGGRGIEWTDYTWNPVGGCHHGCRWRMPDGTIAVCYAETVATRVAQKAYPHGFEHHYWHPQRLAEPVGAPDGSRIFIDSMADLMGHWVPREQIEQVFATCRKTPRLSYQLLTKNAPRYLQFESIPSNVWPGVSAPPTFMNGKELTASQQQAMVYRQLDVLAGLLSRQSELITWMSIEPLSFNIAHVFTNWMVSHGASSLPLKWAVIGAASDGAKLFQPEAAHVENCHRVLRASEVGIFHKGNLAWDPHIEEFPEVRP
jgi:protein gp37